MKTGCDYAGGERRTFNVERPTLNENPAGQESSPHPESRFDVRRSMFNVRRSLFLLLAALLVAGCTSTHSGSRTLATDAFDPAPKTKAEVLRRFGNPAALTTREGTQFLAYNYTHTNGGGLGIGKILCLLIQSEQRCSDNVTFQVGPDGAVQNIRIQANAADASGSIWPF